MKGHEKRISFFNSAFLRRKQNTFTFEDQGTAKPGRLTTIFPE